MIELPFLLAISVASLAAALALGFRAGRNIGKREASLEYQEALSALAEGKPVPQIGAPPDERPTQGVCGPCIREGKFEVPRSLVCRAGSCAHHCYFNCGLGCPGRKA